MGRIPLIRVRWLLRHKQNDAKQRAAGRPAEPLYLQSIHEIGRQMKFEKG